MNTTQVSTLAAEAASRIAEGEDPSGLVHVLYFPTDYPMEEDSIAGLSTALPAGSDLSGYTSRYYTLAEITEAA